MHIKRKERKNEIPAKCSCGRFAKLHVKISEQMYRKKENRYLKLREERISSSRFRKHKKVKLRGAETPIMKFTT